jgi:hypothetical protein
MVGACWRPSSDVRTLTSGPQRARHCAVKGAWAPSDERRRPYGMRPGLVVDSPSRYTPPNGRNTFVIVPVDTSTWSRIS